MGLWLHLFSITSTRSSVKDNQEIVLPQRDKLLVNNLKWQWDIRFPSRPIFQEKTALQYIAYHNQHRAQHLIGRGQPMQSPYWIEHHKQNDDFCRSHEAIFAQQKIGKMLGKNYIWDVLTNRSPAEQYHSLLLPECPVLNQHLASSYTEDLLLLSQLYPELSFAFNSWKAGASQNHFHCHVLFSYIQILQNPLQYKETRHRVNISLVKDYPIVCIACIADNTKDLIICIQKYIQALIVSEIPYNTVFFRGMFYVVPRSKECDDNGVSRGVDTVFGKIPMTSERSFKSFNQKEAEHILRTVGVQTWTFAKTTYSATDKK